MSHQKLNLNACNKLLGSLGDVVDRIVLPRCYIPIALQVRFPHWIFKVHLKLHLGYYPICSYRPRLCLSSPAGPGLGSVWRWQTWSSPPCCSPLPTNLSPPAQSPGNQNSFCLCLFAFALAYFADYIKTYTYIYSLCSANHIIINVTYGRGM